MMTTPDPVVPCPVCTRDPDLDTRTPPERTAARLACTFCEGSGTYPVSSQHRAPAQGARIDLGPIPGVPLPQDARAGGAEPMRTGQDPLPPGTAGAESWRTTPRTAAEHFRLGYERGFAQGRSTRYAVGQRLDELIARTKHALRRWTA